LVYKTPFLPTGFIIFEKSFQNSLQMESLKFMTGVEWLLVGSLFLALIILPVLAILSIFNHEFRGRSNVIWLIVVFVLPVIGPLAYFLLSRWLGRGPRIK